MSETINYGQLFDNFDDFEQFNLSNLTDTVKRNLNHERVNNITNQTEAAHKISQENYIKHPSNRRLTDGEENEINSKFETGGDIKMIAQYMSRKTGKW
ncbi:unnamed protein product [Brachionus calyciflorus]|uniref:Uncharacterized protein n=1 Tax=Brachionus calyciflorus TaxID=104777 RepID=A0A814G6C8_9BILA|nr:unnamed protein product [Brachionus calyciflorus]